MPLHLIYVTTGAAAGHAVNLRNLVVAAPGSRLTVVEHWIGEGAAVNNVVTEISVGANAAVRHVKFQEEGRETVHLSSVDVVAGRDARFDHYSVAIGGAAARTEARVRLAGENAECDLFGVYLGRGEQLTDQLTFVEHAVPHGTSRQIYKGVLDGHARGVFNGLVLVRPGAQKTDAKQSNKNLVLSATADAHARPQLDISADDVKCAHGATVGALDPASLFYLRSRGIDSAEARRLLIRAFAGDVIAEMPEGAIRDYAGEIVTRWLSN
jgi:Fe-S cluster assembly protein SufD